ncbi:MAG TPA: hypothetical protein VK196_16020, partial [Magnetospirillum sp.]|nr:hypothetical protein [Magnetospirillum sp.]
ENAVCAGVAAAGWRSKSAFDPRSGELGECSAAALLADMIAPESLARVMGEDGIEAALEMEFVRLALIALAKGMPRCLAAMELAGGAA